MGQKINPNAIRIVAQTENGYISGSFSNHWYSDIKYCSLYYQDASIKKNQKRILMKYYKSRVRFLKGRRRRLKSILRLCNKSFKILRLPYKINLLSSFFRPTMFGLQRKYTAFIYKTRNKNK